jgi:hypothetical protein
MKRLGVVGLLAVWMLWLTSLAARGDFEHSGSQCVLNQNCGGGNCIVGFNFNNPLCPGSPNGIMCRLYANGAAQAIPYGVCVDSDNSGNCCKGANLGPGQNQVNCGQMDYWNCGCMNGDSNCGYTACSCSGVRDGQVNMTVVSTCTGC